jgi:hypothetical protein
MQQSQTTIPTGSGGLSAAAFAASGKNVNHLHNLPPLCILKKKFKAVHEAAYACFHSTDKKLFHT